MKFLLAIMLLGAGILCIYTGLSGGPVWGILLGAIGVFVGGATFRSAVKG